MLNPYGVLDVEVGGFHIAYRPDDPYNAKKRGSIFVAVPGSMMYMTPDEAIEAAEYLHAIAIHAETQAQKEAKE